MKIGLIDVDGHNFPNLALMKISAYHKAKGDTVEWCEPFYHYDIVYQSKVFGDTYSNDICFIPQADKIIKGGTGYAVEVKNGKEIYHPEYDKPLPYEIEHQYPDYSLYPELTKDTAYGFLTRGCCNNCSFCIVSKKEGCCSKKIADLSEFWNGQKRIKLLDPNLLACKERLLLLQQLSNSQAYIDFTQGLDARFITDETAKAICNCKIDTVHFAFDFMKNEKQIVKGLTIFKEYFTKNDRALKVYVLTNFNTTPNEDWYRVNLISELGYQPYVMIYQKGTHSKFLADLQRWANSPFLFRSTSFQDYIPRKDGKTCGEIYSKYLK
jgi:hypothetical protein